MPSLSATRTAYLAGGDYTDCYCVRIERRDGTIIRFTSFPRDLTMTQKWDNSASPQLSTISEVTYKSNTGYEMTAVSQTASLAIDNIDVLGIYESSGITKSDLLGGVYDGAEVYIFLTDYTAPIEDEHPLKKAIYGVTKLRDNQFSIEFRGLTQFLSQEVGRKITTLSSKSLEEEGVPLSAATWASSTAYSSVKADNDWRIVSELSSPIVSAPDVVKPTTDNGFWYYLSTAGTSDGSEPTWPTTAGETVTDGTCVWTCIYAYAYSATVTAVTDNTTFEATALSTFPDGWFADGVVTWATGNNSPKSIEVLEFDNAASPLESTITLFLTAPFTVQVGDTFTITAGYDRSLAQCRDKFENVVNFGGFPYLPGPRTAQQIGRG